MDNAQLNTFGGEIKFRANFEKEMFKTDSKIPVVTVVIEGGPNTVKCVLESLEAEIPCVILGVIITLIMLT